MTTEEYYADVPKAQLDEISLDISNREGRYIITQAISNIRNDASKARFGIHILQQGGFNQDQYNKIKQTRLYPVAIAAANIPMCSCGERIEYIIGRFCAGIIDEELAYGQISWFIVAYELDHPHVYSYEPLPLPRMKCKLEPHHKRFQHPSDPSLHYGGRGRQPKWLIDWLEQGHKISELVKVQI